MSDLITIGKLTSELPSGSKEIIEDIVIDGKESEEAFLSGRHSVGDNVAVVATVYPLVNVSLEHW